MSVRITQNSFVGGELAPELWGRQDLKKYFEGTAKLRNMVVQRTGGVTKRQGTDLLHDLTSITGYGTGTEGCRLIPFMYDAETSFLIVLVNLKAYFFRNGVPVFEDGRTTFYSVDTPFAFDALADLRFFQSGDTVFITHPDYRPVKMARYDDADWRVTSISFDINVPAPAGVAVQGYDGNSTISEDTGETAYQYAYCVSAIVDGVESRPSSEVTWKMSAPWPNGSYTQITWGAVSGASNYRVYKKSYGTFGFVGNVPVTTSTGEAYTPTLYSTAALEAGYQNNALAEINDGVVNDETGTPAYHASYCVIRTRSVLQAAPLVDCDLGSEKSITGVRIAVGARVLTTGGQVVTLNGGLNSIRIRKSDNGSTWTTVIDATNLGGAGVSDGFLTVQFDGESARYWQLCALAWDNYLPILQPIVIRELQWFSSGVPESFRDVNISQDTSDSPTDATDPWTGGEDYPAVMTLFQQRSVWAGLASTPTQVLMSSLGNLYCFNNSTPLKPEDKIDVRLPVIRPGGIKHLVPMRQLLLLTESSEWVVTYDESKGLAYDTMRMHQSSFYGCCGVEPLSIGNSALFINRAGRIVYEYAYQLQSDGFSANDRMVLSNHLTAGARITGWAHQSQPNSVIWCVLEDGSMLSMTYLPEHEIWAWARHDLAGGTVRAVASTGATLTGRDNDVTNTDEVYLLVERGEQLLLERMRIAPQSDAPVCGVAACLDACQRIELDAPKTSFSIPPTGTAIPDGNYTVINLETGASQSASAAAGVVTVGTAVQYLLLGIAITSEIETLRPEPQQASIQGMRQNVKSVVLRLYRSGGGAAGALGARTAAFALPDSTPTVTASSEGDPDCAVALVTGDSRLSVAGMWNRNGQTAITHASHWPFTILSMATEIDVEGGR